MPYEPTTQDATSAYLAALMHLYGVPFHVIDRQALANVHKTEMGDFLILNDSGCDTSDNILAVCTYFDDDDLWAVQLQNDESLFVRDTDGGFAVVAE